MKITIAFMAGRFDPHLDWMLDGLASQMKDGDDIELLVVDARLRERDAFGDRERAIVERIPGTITIEVVAPKPTIWQGPHRIVATDWWAKSNAINSALVLANRDYIAFLDDCCHLGPRWLEAVRLGEGGRGCVIAGSYDKHELGKVTPDGRRARHPDGLINCGGAWLYGCTFALPLAWALEVGGAEEGVDGMGGEDYLFGLMLANCGRRIDFVPSMRVIQARPEVSPPSGPSAPFKRTDKGISPNDKSHAALARFGKRKRTELTPDLVALRELVRGGGAFPIPDPTLEYRDWYDGQPIREM